MTTKTEPVAQPVKKGHLHPELRATSRILSLLAEFDDDGQFRILDHVAGILGFTKEDERLPPGTSDPRD